MIDLECGWCVCCLLLFILFVSWFGSTLDFRKDVVFVVVVYGRLLWASRVVIGLYDLILVLEFILIWL